MIFIAQAHFAKYKKHNNLFEMINTINSLKSNKTMSISYDIIKEYSVSRAEINHIINVGTLKDYPQILESCLLSTANHAGVWQCILIKAPDNLLILYTAGSADIMYYSFK